MAMVKLQECYDRAHRYMSQGDYDKAEAVCQHILHYYPQDLGTFQLLGQINLERKQARQAREFFRQVLEIDPENVSAHWGMGIAYQDEQNLEHAIAELEQALEIKPDLSDLRSQLLRLYSELYGASRAQLRLNRAGLGRLYVKGDMLDKAVEEFREVLKTDPKRVDVQLTLIEALWRSGRIEDAAEACQDVLDQLPNALKANLILGYVRLAAGHQEEGQQLWRRAAACDPNNTMARAVFEMAPMRIPHDFLAYDAATLPDFDESAYETLRETATAAAPPVEEAVVTPEEEALPPLGEAPARVAEEELLGISWLDALAAGEGEVTGEEVVPGLAPFSLGGLEEVEGGPPAAGMAVALEEEEEAMIPAMGPEYAPPAVVPSARAAEEPIQPFTLEDLGLTPEEISGLQGVIAAGRAEEAPGEVGPVAEVPGEGLPPAEEFVPGIAPFSLEELGAPAAAAGQPAFPEVAPFSLEGLGAPAAGEEPLLAEVAPFSLEDIEAGGLGGLVGELRPFSLEELGLEAPAAGPEAEALAEAVGAMGEEEPGGLPAFSWQEPGMREAPAFTERLAAEEEEVAGGPSLFEKMRARRQEVVGPTPPTPAAEEMLLEGVRPFSMEGLEGPAVEEAAPPEEALAAGLRPFSLEDLGLEAPAAEEAAPAAAAPAAERPLFALEELGAPAAEEAIEELPAGVAPFSLEELGLEPPLVEAAVPGEEVPSGLQPFSLEDLGLEAPAEAAAPAVEEAVPMAREPVAGEEAIRPFSLEELGLTREEIAGLGLSREELARIGMGPAPAAAVVEEAPVVEEAAPVKVAAIEEVTAPVEALPSLDELRQRLAAEPANEELRLQLAQACRKQGEFAEATEQYKGLIKRGKAGLEETIIADLRAWIEQEWDRQRLHRLHRLLGDAYMKAGSYQQAINEYAWVLSK